ncbi:MAG: hypothetical protein PHC64_07110 [Candidatus Gastranaerophilales bacterium]|nr:hypothetical protein [Candidatus Gastranaerophilales bacterium]
MLHPDAAIQKEVGLTFKPNDIKVNKQRRCERISARVSEAKLVLMRETTLSRTADNSRQRASLN